MAKTTTNYCPVCEEEVETIDGVCLMCGERLTDAEESESLSQQQDNVEDFDDLDGLDDFDDN